LRVVGLGRKAPNRARATVHCVCKAADALI
jgi:hypothetical protein